MPLARRAIVLGMDGASMELVVRMVHEGQMPNLGKLMAEGAWRDWREAHVLALADPAVVRCIARSFRQAAVVVVRAGRKARLFAIK